MGRGLVVAPGARLQAGPTTIRPCLIDEHHSQQQEESSCCLYQLEPGRPCRQCHPHLLHLAQDHVPLPLNRLLVQVGVLHVRRAAKQAASAVGMTAQCKIGVPPATEVARPFISTQICASGSSHCSAPATPPHLQDVGQDVQRLGHVLLKHLGVVARLCSQSREEGSQCNVRMRDGGGTCNSTAAARWLHHRLVALPCNVPACCSHAMQTKHHKAAAS